MFIGAVDIGIFIIWMIVIIRGAHIKFHYALIFASFGTWLFGLGLAGISLREFGTNYAILAAGDPSRLAGLMGDALIIGATATHSLIKILMLAVIGLLIYKPKPVSAETTS